MTSNLPTQASTKDPSSTTQSQTKKNSIDKIFPQADSITRVNFRLDGPRATCSFKGNKKLWKAFVSEIKAQGLSVCHLLEPFQLAYLTAKVYLSHTIRPLKIENLIVERAVKRVRRYAVEVEEEESRVQRSDPPCFYCSNPSVGRFEFVKTGKKVWLCEWHVEKYVIDSAYRRVTDG